MKRLTWVIAVAVLSFGCQAPTAAPDSGYVAGKSGLDGGSSPKPGSDGGSGSKALVVVSSGNALPFFRADSAAFLSSDGTGSQSGVPATSVLNQRVLLDDPTVANQSPCPLPGPGGSCDGFNAVDGSGYTLVVDTYQFRSGLAGCTIPTNGGSFSTLSGIWYDRVSTDGGVDLFVLAPATCGDLGLGNTYMGAGDGGASTDIAQLNSSFAPGSSVTVTGVVVGVWMGGKQSFGFTLEDPQGGYYAGVPVYKASSSKTAANAPGLGDLVQVTGTTSITAQGTQELDL